MMRRSIGQLLALELMHWVALRSRLWAARMKTRLYRFRFHYARARKCRLQAEGERLRGENERLRG